MTTVTIQELQANARAVIAKVRAGETVLVADEGQTVAEISSGHDARERALGIVPPPRRSRDLTFERSPLAPGRDVLDLLSEVRADRELLH